MKKILGLLSVLLVFSLGTNAWSFTAGNLVVYRMGDGATVDTLTNVGCAVFLDEYTTAGAFVSTVMMPTNFFGGYYPVIGNGSATADGYMTLSADGRFLVVPGYGARLGGGSSALSGISAGTVPRVYATVDGSNHVDSTTAQTNNFSNAENPRSGASTDGTNLWISGDVSGLRYTTRGGATATQLATTVTNLRQVNIYTNTLCFSDASGSAIRIGTITNAMPVTATGSFMDTLGANVPTGTGSPYGFVLLKMGGGSEKFDTLYYADDTTPGTIYKYCLVSGTWQARGSFTASNVRGLTGKKNGANVNLYMTTAPATPGSGEYTGGGYLLGYTDSAGFNANLSGDGGDIGDFADFANATPTRKVLRGVAFAPQGFEQFPAGVGKVSVGPLAGYAVSGLTGGSFLTKDYSLGNPGTNTVAWKVNADTNWVTFSSTTGSLTAGSTNTVTASISAGALTAGTYTATITFSNTTDNILVGTRPVTLTITDQSLTPSTDFTASGPPGGPFAPANKAYVVTNGANATTYTAGASTNYFTVTPSSGSLGSFSSVTITVAVNTAVVNPLAAGNYSATIAFSNATKLIDTRAATVLDGSSFIFDDFSTNFNSGDLVGQSGWLQLGTTSANALQVSGGAVVFPGNQQAAGQTAFKAFPVISNETVSVFLGMRMALTYAPTNSAEGLFQTAGGPSYMVPLYSANNGTATAGNFANYRFSAHALDSALTNFVVGARVNGQASCAWLYDNTDKFATNQIFNVVIRTDIHGSNMVVYVNPTSATLSAQVTNIFSTLTTNAIGAAITNVGAVGISQFGTAAIPSCGGKFYKIAVSTNYADVYNFLVPAAGAPVADFSATPVSGTAPLSVTFTNKSTGSFTNSLWDFGDASTLNAGNGATNVVHSYAAGTWSPKLIVTGTGGVSTNTQVNLITATSTSPQQAWSNYYGVAANAADADGDGVSNTNEFLTGFNPKNGDAYAHVISVVRSGASEVITYLGANGDTNYAGGPSIRTNVLDFTTGDPSGGYSNNFTSTGKTNILSNGNGSGVVTNMVDPNGATSVPARYYRVRVLTP